jgi:transposase, IS30 family
MGVLVMGRPRLAREVERRFWARVRGGDSVRVAAVAVGVGSASGDRWFRQAGGVMPSEEESTGRRLSLTEREEIACRRAGGEGVREIARGLGRDPSTISRELRRVGTGGRGGPYRASVAQADADRKARRPKAAKLATNLVLRREVQARLEHNHSPEQIAWGLRDDFPDQVEMRVSPETIYQSIYVQGRGGLRRELAKHLRTGRVLRKPRRRPGERRGRIPGMVNISERPAEIDDRAVPGHWEGDLIVGANSESAIGTLVERMTGFALLLHLPHDHGALAVQDAIIAKMSDLPDILRQTLTWDQGREMANHVQIAAATDLDIYFCDPHAPWQRATNENTNGLLRQYFPKRTDLSVHGAGYLDYVAAELNNRPRKRLNWKTPAQALDQLLSQPSDPGVAVTG